MKHHQKGNQQHNNTLSAYYLVCMMISVCALCCVHSSIPTISNGDSVTRKGIYLQKILEKTHIQAHNTRHRKRRTSFQRKNQSAMNVCECLR